MMMLFKRGLMIMASIMLLVVLSLMIHNAWAAKPLISLNSPVSFPVDI